MRETVSIHIGQAGCQIGDSVWDLLGQEHNLTRDGFVTENCDSFNTETARGLTWKNMKSGVF